MSINAKSIATLPYYGFVESKIWDLQAHWSHVSLHPSQVLEFPIPVVAQFDPL
jgi:hypothetical protein